MNKKTLIIIGIIVGLVVIGGGVYAYTNSQTEESESDSTMPAPVSEQSQPNNTAPPENADEVTSSTGGYVSYAEYTADPAEFADTTVVYFFHASWCPICVSIDKDFSSDESEIPANTTMVKVDYDNATDLRKKYGVTTQYTFVQVDASGDEVAQWTATSASSAIAGIES